MINKSNKKYSYLSAFTFDILSSCRQSAGLADRSDTPVSGGVGIEHEAEPHHSWNVTQIELKVDPFVPLDGSAVHDPLLRTVDTRTEVLSAMVERCSYIHLYR